MMLLFAADRVDHCEMIKKRLEEGFLVLTDRYRDSSYIYQSVQAQFKNEDITMDWVKEINKMSLNPDLTIILDIDPEISLKRRQDANKETEDELEKFEQIDFQKAIREAFLNIAHEHIHDEHDKHIIIHANAEKDDIFNEILNVLMCRNIEERIEKEG